MQLFRVTWNLNVHKKRKGRKKEAEKPFKAFNQFLTMKGIIESLRFPTDVKDQRYAIAVIGGEEIYSWDERILGYLRGLKPGAEIEYELMSRGGKFKKFKNITSGESGGVGVMPPFSPSPNPPIEGGEFESMPFISALLNTVPYGEHNRPVQKHGAFLHVFVISPT